MIGDIEVRISVRLMVSAAALRLWRMTSVVIGSASAATAAPLLRPAR